MADVWAVAGSAAAVAGVILTVITVRSQQKSSRRGQASKVTAGLRTMSIQEKGYPRFVFLGQGIKIIEVQVDNLSELPIYDIRIRSRSLKPVQLPGERLIARLDPRGRYTALYQSEWDADILHRSGLVSVSFTDAGGRHWQRVVGGRLRALREAPY
jgi:hypothetical protein